MFAFLLALAISEPPQLPLPDLAGNSSYGQVTQAGPVLTFLGGNGWEASGVIQADGTIRVTWMHQQSGRSAMGIYTAGEGGISGRWGWMEEIEVTAAGIKGATFPEVIRIERERAKGPDL